MVSSVSQSTYQLFIQDITHCLGHTSESECHLLKLPAILKDISISLETPISLVVVCEVLKAS